MKIFHFLSLALLGTPVLAAKFTGVKSCITSSGELLVQGTLSGAGQPAQITLSGTGKAECVCVTKSGQTPAAANKNNVAQGLTDTGQFCPTPHGGVPFCLTIGPPSPSCESGLHCGTGQQAQTTFTYTNVKLTSTGGTAKDNIGDVSSPCSQNSQTCLPLDNNC